MDISVGFLSLSLSRNPNVSRDNIYGSRTRLVKSTSRTTGRTKKSFLTNLKKNLYARIHFQSLSSIPTYIILCKKKKKSQVVLINQPSPFPNVSKPKRWYPIPSILSKSPIEPPIKKFQNIYNLLQLQPQPTSTHPTHLSLREKKKNLLRHEGETLALPSSNLFKPLQTVFKLTRPN